MDDTRFLKKIVYTLGSAGIPLRHSNSGFIEKRTIWVNGA